MTWRRRRRAPSRARGSPSRHTVARSSLAPPRTCRPAARPPAAARRCRGSDPAALSDAGGAARQIVSDARMQNLAYFAVGTPPPPPSY